MPNCENPSPTTSFEPIVTENRRIARPGSSELWLALAWTYYLGENFLRVVAGFPLATPSLLCAVTLSSRKSAVSNTGFLNKTRRVRFWDFTPAGVKRGGRKIPKQVRGGCVSKSLFVQRRTYYSNCSIFKTTRAIELKTCKQIHF